jgi:DNA polymerase-3 subunit delta
MQINASQLSARLGDGSLPHVILIFGDEPQQVIEALDSVRAVAQRRGFVERTSLTADSQFDWDQLLDAAQSMSLFSDKQFIELHLPTGKPGVTGGKVLQQLQSVLHDDLLLVIHGPRIGKDVQNTKWFKTITSSGWFVPCYPLEGKALKQWLQQLLQRAGLTVEPHCVDFIADACEGNMLAAYQEVQKLALLYPSQPITLAMCQTAIVEQSRFNVFQLVDEVLSGDSDKIIKLLHRLEGEGVEPNIIIWSLLKEWQTLVQLKAMLAQGQSITWQRFGIWQQRQGLYQRAMQRLDQARLNHIGQQLGVADKAFKSTVQSRPYVTLAHLCLLFSHTPAMHIEIAAT